MNSVSEVGTNSRSECELPSLLNNLMKSEVWVKSQFKCVYLSRTVARNSILQFTNKFDPLKRVRYPTIKLRIVGETFKAI